MSKTRNSKTVEARNRADVPVRSVRAEAKRFALVGRELKDTSAAINSLRADVINLIDRVRRLETVAGSR